MKIGFVTVGAFEKEDYINNNLLGTENQVFGLSKELSKKGHEVFIFRRWYCSSIEKFDDITIVSYKSPNYQSGFLTILSKLKFSRDISKFKNLKKLDIIILIDPFTSYYLQKLKMPKITILHNEIPRELLPNKIFNLNKSIILNLKTKILKLAQKRLYDNSSVLVCLNTHLYKYLRERSYDAVLIPNGIDLKRYIPSSNEKNYILYGGRLVKGKCIDHLINAYNLLDNDLKNNFQLYIVGFGNEEENLKNLVKNLEMDGNVKFINWVDSERFKDLIDNCALFILPSAYETFGMVILEAMALRKTVIASDISGPKDLIKHNNSGFCYEQGNINQLKNYLDVLLRNGALRFEIGRNARKNVENSYTFDKVSDEYLKLFNELLNEK